MCDNIIYEKCIKCHNYPALTMHNIELKPDGERVEYISCPFAGSKYYGGTKGWAFKNGECIMIANCR